MSLLERHMHIAPVHLVLMMFLAFILVAYWPFSPKAVTSGQTSESNISLPFPFNQEITLPTFITGSSTTEKEKVTVETQVEHKVVIQSGDTLSMLFDRLNLGQSTLYTLLSADESLLALETLRPGHTLYFRYKENTQYLEEMELFIHAGQRIVYRRVAEDEFEYENIIREGQWHNERVSGSIDGAFYVSAQRAGLTEMEAAVVTQIFEEQLDFSRVIRQGDQFQIVRSVQYVDDQPTGQTRIESARLQRRVHEHTAFLFEDGRYYDKDGKSLSRAFTRTPLAKSYRISSPFNPKRVHPVTGRVGPHNGTDFATPTGTRVLTTGDGVVSRVGNHPFAGRYVEIQHGGQYKTRYLHLHRVLVRRGESVNRGQAIALSGNTGRSTGPHLHFELHIQGRPVDPMKAKIPLERSISKQDRSVFLTQVAKQTDLLDTPFEEMNACEDFFGLVIHCKTATTEMTTL